PSRCGTWPTSWPPPRTSSRASPAGCPPRWCAGCPAPPRRTSRPVRSRAPGRTTGSGAPASSPCGSLSGWPPSRSRSHACPPSRCRRGSLARSRSRPYPARAGSRRPRRCGTSPPTDRLRISWWRRPTTRRPRWSTPPRTPNGSAPRWALLSALESTGPRPALAWYGEAARIELSGHVVANWVIKAIGHLHDEIALDPDDEVVVDLPPHWKRLTLAVACWALGARVTVLGRE